MTTREAELKHVGPNQAAGHALDFLSKREAGADAVSFIVVIVSLKRMTQRCPLPNQARHVKVVRSAIGLEIFLAAKHADVHRVSRVVVVPQASVRQPTLTEVSIQLAKE